MIRTATVVTDCCDRNAAMRLTARISSLHRCPTQVVGAVGNAAGGYADLEASGHLVDALDAIRLDGEGVNLLIGNVAPRDRQKSGTNGSPFGYFRLGPILVVTTVGGHTLSLVRQLKIIPSITVVDTFEALRVLVQARIIDEEEASRIAASQFRGLEFAPIIAWWLAAGHDLPGREERLLDPPALAPFMVWSVDCFRNVKLGALASQTGWEAGQRLRLIVRDQTQEVVFTPRLADVPDGAIALTTGSSGFDGKRFHELVINGGRAADVFGLDVGDQLSIEVVT